MPCMLQPFVKRRFNVVQFELAALMLLGIMGQFATGAVLTVLICVGDMTRNMTMRSSRRAISDLVSPSGETAWIGRDESVVET